MLAEAACKLEGFTYAPNDSVYWQHGHSTERDFIYVTTQNLSPDQLRLISEQIGPERTLLICCGELSYLSLQFLIDQSVALLLAELAALGLHVGGCISLDTKHILAWVKENNPKAYVPERFNKNKQPAGDPDCKLGCKRKHNRHLSKPQITPGKNALPARTLAIGEYYWGYGSGIVVVKVPNWGEFVLAEKTHFRQT